MNKELLQFENLEAWIQSYQEHKRLPKHKILCSVCKETETAMLPNSNLKQVDRNFGGDIRLMLTTFACRNCRNSKKPSTEVYTKYVKKEKTEAVVESFDLPKIDFRKPPVFLDLTQPEAIAKVTTGHCHRPDLFLGANRSCDTCGLFEHCKALIKKRSRNYQPKEELVVA